MLSARSVGTFIEEELCYAFDAEARYGGREMVSASYRGRKVVDQHFMHEKREGAD